MKIKKKTVNKTNNDHFVQRNVSADPIDLKKGRKYVGVVKSMHGNKNIFFPWFTSV